jgi:Asp-tRNA(Asn)/Glu-tRNA(Gln) amidotransferase B subunit
MGHRAVIDERLLSEIVEKTLSLRHDLIKKAREDPKVFNFLIGQVMQQHKKADPRVVARLLRDRLNLED